MLDKIAEMFGADPTHYRQLLKVERAVATHALAEKRRISRANLTLGLTCFVCFIVSASFAVITVIQPLDAFSYALLTLSCTMVMAVLFSLPHFDIILSPTNYLVLAHTPVSSRTYFLVKLTQLLTYAAMLLGSLSLLPATFGLWTIERNPFFPVIYLPISFIAGFFHDWIDDGVCGVFDKTLYERATPKYCSIRTVGLCYSLSGDLFARPSHL
jgi:hypothetical protein